MEDFLLINHYYFKLKKGLLYVNSDPGKQTFKSGRTWKFWPVQI